MREYNEVMNLILEVANSDDDVRVVMMNGSRVNSNVTPDIMQDYDIVFFLRNFNKLNYKNNREWIHQFGELVILQQNDFDDGSYVFLMQFKDGVRIDLRFCDINTVKEVVQEDTLSMILLDKESCVYDLPLPSDKGYWVKRPSIEEWDKLLNEAWWIQTYIAKGIWRDELPLVKYMYDVILIEVMRRLLSWHIGEQTEFRANVGKCGKFFKQLLDVELYRRFTGLYCKTDYEDIWERLFEAGVMIREIGIELGKRLGYNYPYEDDKNVTEYIQRIRNTPKDITDIS